MIIIIINDFISAKKVYDFQEYQAAHTSPGFLLDFRLSNVAYFLHFLQFSFWQTCS